MPSLTSDEHGRLLTRYLLGDISDSQRAAIEERYLRDDGRYEDLLAVEAELLDHYVRGELSDSDRVRFEARYGGREELERIAFARALQRTPLPPAQEPRSLPIAVARSRPAYGRPAFVGIAAAAALVVGAAVWIIQNRSSRTEAGVAPALSHVPAPTAEPARRIASLELRAGSFRDGGERTRLVLGTDVDMVRLTIPIDGARAATFRASLETVDGLVILSAGGLQPVQPDVLAWTIPAARLQRDDYIVRVHREDPGGHGPPVGEFSFRVERPAPAR